MATIRDEIKGVFISANNRWMRMEDIRQRIGNPNRNLATTLWEMRSKFDEVEYLIADGKTRNGYYRLKGVSTDMDNDAAVTGYTPDDTAERAKHISPPRNREVIRWTSKERLKLVNYIVGHKLLIKYNPVQAVQKAQAAVLHPTRQRDTIARTPLEKWLFPLVDKVQDLEHERSAELNKPKPAVYAGMGQQPFASATPAPPPYVSSPYAPNPPAVAKPAATVQAPDMSLALTGLMDLFVLRLKEAMRDAMIEALNYKGE